MGKVPKGSKGRLHMCFVSKKGRFHGGGAKGFKREVQRGGCKLLAIFFKFSAKNRKGNEFQIRCVI